MTYYYPSTETDSEDISQEIKNHFIMLSEQLGYNVLPKESYLNAYANGLDKFGFPKKAKSLFELNVEYYPKSANVHSAMGNFYLRHKDTSSAIQNYEKALSIEEIEHVRSRLEQLKKN